MTKMHLKLVTHNTSLNYFIDIGKEYTWAIRLYQCIKGTGLKICTSIIFFLGKLTLIQPSSKMVVLLQRRTFDEQRAGNVDHAFEGHRTPVFHPLPVYTPLEERYALHVQIPLFWSPSFRRRALLVAF